MMSYEFYNTFGRLLNSHKKLVIFKFFCFIKKFCKFILEIFCTKNLENSQYFVNFYKLLCDILL